MLVTDDVSQEETSPLKLCANLNIEFMSVTLETSQEETLELKS